MPALPDKAGAKLFQRFLVVAVVNLSDAAFNLMFFLKGLTDNHPIGPAHRLEESFQVMPQKA